MVRARTAGGARPVAQLRMRALPGHALVFRARVLVVALRILAAGRAAHPRAAQGARCASGRDVLTQIARARIVRTRVFVVATGVVGASFLVPAAGAHRAVLIHAARAVVRRMRACTCKTIVVRAAHAVVAVGLAAAFTARAVATLLGRVTLGRALARAVRPALIDGARVTVVAVFRPATGFRRSAARASTGPRARSAGARVATDATIHGARATATGSRKLRATAGVGGERAERE
jgi:hypothetical protein